MERRKITAEELYNELINVYKLKEKVGSVEINIGGITASYNGKDAIGDLIQEWLGKWLKENHIAYGVRSNSQEFPDFILDEENDKNFLELKTFNADASPAFDLANFDSYCTSLLSKPSRLDADYLIISYRMIDSKLSIGDVWLKKIWEITSKSGVTDIKLQIKRKQIYNIRPCTWYSNRLRYEPFESRKLFVESIAKVHNNYLQCDKYKDNWFNNVKNRYEEQTGVEL